MLTYSCGNGESAGKKAALGVLNEYGVLHWVCVSIVIVCFGGSVGHIKGYSER